MGRVLSRGEGEQGALLRLLVSQESSQVGHWNPSGLYGLDAPFWLQIARKHLGGPIVYPIDLGTLSHWPCRDANRPKWTVAVRMRASVYARPWRTIPIVFGGGADFLPRFERPTIVRGAGVRHVGVTLVLMY